ncbi:MAG: transcriptional regulator, LacI family, partial [Firmicutes bacterium]|nr:transcriptional regulator, LacI family [Bacillota bacterium]
GVRLTVTLRDVARRAGVDVSTVSRVVRGERNFSVRAETRERILQVAAELDYRPNGIARSLKSSFTRTLGMLIPDITNPIFPAIYKGVEDTARQLGYSVILVNTGTRSQEEDPNIALLREKRVDGFILATAFTADALIERLERDRYPAVLVNRRMPGMTERFVAPDDALGSRLAMAHLMALGHRRIAHISGPLYTETGLSRFTAYRRSLNENALPFVASWVQESDFNEEGGYRAMAQLLQAPELPTAVFCGNDLAAVGAMRMARERGLELPRDLSIVGFNDLPWTDRIQPSLTTIRIPLYEMGAMAARMLLQVIAGERPDPPFWLAPPELVIRASTAPPL